MVGTHCVCVIRYFSMSRREFAASNFSITIAVPPSRNTVVQLRSGAE
jgi:hypothetical protein